MNPRNADLWELAGDEAVNMCSLISDLTLASGSPEAGLLGSALRVESSISGLLMMLDAMDREKGEFNPGSREIVLSALDKTERILRVILKDIAECQSRLQERKQ